MREPKKYFVYFLFYFANIARLCSCMVWSLNRILLTGPKGYLSLAGVVAQGAKYGIHECRHQFTWERWDCPYDESFMLTSPSYQHGTREHAFVHAIVSAGVTHRLVRNCSQVAHYDCPCDLSKIGHRGGYNWKWGGCSDNIFNALLISRQFLDAMETGKDARAAMNLHNNEAGRRAVKKKMKLVCKCHGVSGSCTTKTCWKQLSDLRTVGDYIKRRYRRAKIVNFHEGHLQLGNAAKNGHKIPFSSNLDLVYLDRSPDYCNSNATARTAGTLHRQCSRGNRKSRRLSDKMEARSCHNLCVKCGYRVRRRPVVVTASCNCQFLWCCSVRCENCTSIARTLRCVL